MGLIVYNTLTRRKEPFEPLERGRVKMYVCGPTVYDLLHIGNFRGGIFFNLVRNWLEHLGYRVTYVYNYTDVDDKIIRKAREEGVSASEIGRRYIAEFERDFAGLKLKKHDHNPRVSEHMEGIVQTVQKIVDRGHAYVDGDVFYSVKSFKRYGCLSGKKLDRLKAGGRVEVDPRKRDPGDFVLWKTAKPGEPAWDSPWGKGRPGWHIECTAMVRDLLGESIDIHGGGMDLVFPHHENEIAQGEACGKAPYCRYWMHNEFIHLNDEKMSKSLGNVISGRDFMQKYHPEILKFVMLSSHYRSAIRIDEERVSNAIAGLRRVYKALKEAGRLSDGHPVVAERDEAVAEALNDDFNTGAMMARIYEEVRRFNLKKPSKSEAGAFRAWVLKWGGLMSLFQEPPEEFLKRLDGILLREKKIDSSKVEELISERTKARESGHWERSDRIRDQLLEMQIAVQDGPDGTTWEVLQ